MRASAPMIAASCLLLEMVAFTLTNVSLRLGAEEAPVHMIVFLRFLFCALLLTPFVVRDVMHGTVSWVAYLRSAGLVRHFLRAACGYASAVTWTYSLVLLPLATATSIFFTKTFFVGILSTLLISQKATPRQWSAMFLAFIGVLLVLRPWQGIYSPAGVLFALGSAVTSALVAVQAKALCRSHSPLIMTFFLVVFMTFFSAWPAFLHWQTPSGHVLAVALFAAAFLIASQFLLLRAYRIVALPTAALLEFGRLILSVIAGMLVFDEVVDGQALAGGLVIIAAISLGLGRSTAGKQVVQVGSLQVGRPGRVASRRYRR